MPNILENIKTLKEKHGSHLQDVYSMLRDMTKAHKTTTELLNSVGNQCELKRSDNNKNAIHSSFTYIISVKLYKNM